VEILITGANGLLGHYLVTALRERGDAVRALVLPADDAAWLEERGVAIYRGDIRQPETLGAPMRGVEGVFHVAGMIGMWRPMQDYRDVNVAGTENVCRAALDAGVKRLVHVSSTIVYGMDLGRPVTEDFPLAPFSDPYAITKAEGDRLVQRMIAEEGLPGVIVRPDQFFGPGDRLHFGSLANRLRAGNGVIIGSGRNAVPLIYVTDVVQGLLLALDHPGATGQAYNITNDQYLTQEELYRSIAAAIGADPTWIHVPYALMYAATYAVEGLFAATQLKRRPPVTRLGIAFFGTGSRHSIDKARRELGFAPQVPLREGVRLAAAWYLHQDTWALDSVPAGARQVGRAS
jgi:nucleoside-diphosphate-sugar epimerase